MNHDAVCIDFETYYDDEYSLKKISTTDYIRSDQFLTQSVCIGWRDGRRIAVRGSEARNVLRSIDWRNTGVIAHHAQFDGLILTHHFGCYPAFWYDTLSMARMVLGTDASVSLNAVSQRLGFGGKQFGEALLDVKGKRVLSEEETQKLLEYNEFDVQQTLNIFERLLPFLPERELRTIDMTIRMYAEPVLVLDDARIAKVLAEEREHKRALFSRVEGAEWLSSAKAMAAALEALGVEPPTKISPRTKKLTYAFSKSDLEFKALLEHPVDAVRDLVEARLAVKSTLIETRAQSILTRKGLPTPIYLNYWGARTGRWSGGDGVNWQNLPRRGRGAELRRALMAPPGTKLVIADASQIEARLLAWCAEDNAVVDAFAAGKDVYALAASDIYGRPIDREVDKDEGFVGKVFTLGAGYGAGPAKINYMLRIGQFGPPVHQSLSETEQHLSAWRAARRATVQYWKHVNNLATMAFLNGVPTERAPVAFSLSQAGDGLIQMPDGTVIRYPKVRYDAEWQQMVYEARNGTVKLYGGILTENIVQALATRILVEQIDDILLRMPECRVVMSTHDEIVMVVPNNKVDDALETVETEMSTAPLWADGLPLNAKVHTSAIYDKV